MATTYRTLDILPVIVHSEDASPMYLDI